MGVKILEMDKRETKTDLKKIFVCLKVLLFHNGLINERIQFFTDGHKMLNDRILGGFS